MSENINQNYEKSCCKKYKNLLCSAFKTALKATSDALIYGGKLGLELADKYDDIKDVAQKIADSKISEESAKTEGVSIISQERAKEIFAKRINAQAEMIKFDEIYLSKGIEICRNSSEKYIYKIRAEFNGFAYKIKVGAISGEILNLRIESRI